MSEAAPASRAATGAISHSSGAFWRQVLTPYAQSHLGRSLLDIATSVIPYLVLSVVMYLALGVSYPLVLAIAVPTAGFLVNTFILFHDCSHGSFLASTRANAWLGVALGLLVYSPFVRWRHEHAIHHATSGDLDRRGVGDVRTLTVAEYLALPWRGRMGYRLFRNPLVMFGIGPIVALVVGPRLVSRSARPRMRRSVIGTNIALAVLVAAKGAPVLFGQHRPSPHTPSKCSHPQLQLAAGARSEPDLPPSADALPLGWSARRAAQAVGRGSETIGDLRRSPQTGCCRRGSVGP